MNKVFAILAPQEYKTANHKQLWSSIIKNYSDHVVIVDVPADLVVSIIKGKKYRISESKQGFRKESDKGYIYRPIFFIRPEIMPKIYQKICAKSLVYYLCKQFSVQESDIIILSYNAFWVSALYDAEFKGKIAYYLYDEVKLFANNSSINKKKAFFDIVACSRSDIIFAMSNKIIENREQFKSKCYLIGNGATRSKVHYSKIPNSAAFVGNFRNWIDEDLLNNIIDGCPQIDFYFCGPIENQMLPFFQKTINKHINCFYCGIKDKDTASAIYSKFNCIIIPYLQNDFIQSTRPIKIVESVINGTPAVSVPVSGYTENSFIKFARNSEDFIRHILSFNSKEIDTTSDDYLKFCRDNSWDSIAARIIELVNNL